MFEFVRQWMRRWLGIEATEKEARATEKYISKEIRTLETWVDDIRNDFIGVDGSLVSLGEGVKEVRAELKEVRAELGVFTGKVEDLDDEVGDVRDEIQGIRDSQAHLMHRVGRVQDRVFPEQGPPSKEVNDLVKNIQDRFALGEAFDVRDMFEGIPNKRGKTTEMRRLRSRLTELVKRGVLSRVNPNTFRRLV